MGNLGKKVFPTTHPTDTVTSCRKEFVTKWIGKRELNSNLLIRTFLLKTGIFDDSLKVIPATITESVP